MAGTKEGGLKAAAKNKSREPGFYARIGAIGGRKGNSGGFAAATHPNGCRWSARAHRVAECAGAKGGAIRRQGSKI